MTFSKLRWPWTSPEPKKTEIPVLKTEVNESKENLDSVSIESFNLFASDLAKLIQRMESDAKSREESIISRIESMQKSIKKELEKQEEAISNIKIQAPSSSPVSTNNYYMTGFDKGFETGIRMASTFDAKLIEKVRQESIEESLRRMNGNHS